MRQYAALWAMLSVLVSTGGCGAISAPEPAPAASAPEPPPAAAVEPSSEPAEPDRPRRAGAGESCEQRHCADGMVCVGYADGPRCSEACDLTDPFCATGALCVRRPSRDDGVCAMFGLGDEGAPCATATDCQPNLACVSVRGADPTCVRACDFVADRFPCPDERACAIAAGLEQFGVCEPEM